MSITTVLLIAALFALIVLLFLARRRSKERFHSTKSRERRVLAEIKSESMFMPVAELEGAVEVVDMDALLKGEVAGSRRATIGLQTVMRSAQAGTLGSSLMFPAQGSAGVLAAKSTLATAGAIAGAASSAAASLGSGAVGVGEIPRAEVRSASTVPFAVTLAADGSHSPAAPEQRLAMVEPGFHAGQVVARQATAGAKPRTVPQPPTLIGNGPHGNPARAWRALSDIDESTQPMGVALDAQLGDALAAARARGSRLGAPLSAPMSAPISAPLAARSTVKSTVPGDVTEILAHAAVEPGIAANDTGSPGGSERPVSALDLQMGRAVGQSARNAAAVSLGSVAANGGAAVARRKVATASRGLIDAPLRELALAWFEARGYRSSPASEAVRPIQLVLRHREDPSRAYAFVVQSDRVDMQSAMKLLDQAQSIGLLRLLIAAEGGAHADVHALLRRKGVRVLDRIAMQNEVDKLELPVAAKIIALARARSRPAVASA